MRDDEDIRKQDCAIKGKPPYRLDGDFSRTVAVIGQFEKTTLFCPERSIFGKIATRLTHQPDRGNSFVFTP